jgi:hypothetical protein
MPRARRKKKKETRKIAKNRKKSTLRKITKWHILCTGLVLAAYLTLGFWLGPEALREDIKGKVAGASTVLSLHISGPPGKPLVEVQAGCDGVNPYIDISWQATTDTDNYDIYRDGALLISGKTNTYYRDGNVISGNSYSYYVIANGPLGSTQSDTVSAIASSQCYAPPPPPPPEVICRITTLDKIDLTNFHCLPKTKKKTPLFSGTTNVSNAQIQAEISTPSAKRKVISSFTANENGYWFWPVRGQMKKGMKTLYVKSVDPSDSNRFGTCSLRFKVGKAYKKKQLRKCTGATLVQSLSVPPDYNFSEFLDLQFSGPEKFVFAGDDINFKVNLEKAFPAMTSEQKIVFQLVDSQNNSVYQEEKKISPEKDRKIFDSFRVPPYVGSGQYKVITQLMEGDKIITAEKSIEVKEKPLLSLVQTGALPIFSFCPAWAG